MTSLSSIKAAKCRLMQSRPHNSLGSLVLGCQRRSWQNSSRVTPKRFAKFSSRGRLKSAIFCQYLTTCQKWFKIET